MNFNLSLQVEKVMKQISDSQTLRRWTYVIGTFGVIALFVWQLAPILQACAVLVATFR